MWRHQLQRQLLALTSSLPTVSSLPHASAAAAVAGQQQLAAGLALAAASAASSDLLMPHRRLPGTATFAASACQQQLQARFLSSSTASSSSEVAHTAPAKVLHPAQGMPDEPPPQYRRTGAVDGPYTVQPQAAFAVVEVGAAQYKVTADDLIFTERLSGVDINDTVALERVLLLGSRDETVVGRPFIPGASVSAVVEEQFLDAKVLIFKKRRRKNSRRLNGHRQPLTALRITRVEQMGAGQDAARVEEGSEEGGQQQQRVAAGAAA